MASKTKTRTKPKKKSKNKKNKSDAVIIIVAVVLVFLSIAGAVLAVIVIHSNSHTKSVPLNLEKDIAYGVDVSSHNGKINWETVKDEVDFAFIRVGARGYSKGNIVEDKRADYNLKNANKAGVPVGVYFYSQAISEEEAIEEATFALKKIQKYDISLPVVIDFEYASTKSGTTGRLYEANLTKREKTNLINAFCKTVENAGYTPAVYASTYIYESHIYTKKLNKNAVIWVADYNENITYDGYYDIWQFSEKGKIKGTASKYVDENYWYLEDIK